MRRGKRRAASPFPKRLWRWAIHSQPPYSPTTKSLNNNDRDQVLSARETEHSTQTLVFTKTAGRHNLVEVVVSEVFPLLKEHAEHRTTTHTTGGVVMAYSLSLSLCTNCARALFNRGLLRRFLAPYFGKISITSKQ